MKTILCWIGFHEWETHQRRFQTNDIGPPWINIVIAWRQCSVCAASRLIHILE